MAGSRRAARGSLITASSVTAAADTPSASRPRLGGISFLHRFGSALNHHVHLHACVTDGVFVAAAAEANTDAPPAFLPARPITHVDLSVLTERVRREEAPAPLPRRLCPEPQAQAGSDGAGDWERRQAGQCRDRRAWGRRSWHGRLL